MRAFLRLLAVAGLVLLTAGPHVLAQGENVLVRPPVQPGAKNPFGWLFGSAGEDRKAAPRARRTYEPKRRSVSAPPASVVRPSVAPGVPATPAEGEPPAASETVPAAPSIALNVLVVGDSLAGLLAQGLRDTYMDRPGIVIHGKSRDSSGLVRDDFYDWAKSFREMLAGTETYDAVVIMVGTNDRQVLRDAEGAHEPRSERWRALYAARIDAMIASAREKGVRLFWVGMPTMRAERYSGDMLAFNDIFRQRAQQANVSFVDIWEAFGDEAGAYAVSGPDVSGAIVRLRTGDGVHFTRAGARKAAFFVDKEFQPIIAAAEARLLANAPNAVAPALQAARPGGPLVLAPPPDIAPALPRSLQTTDALLGIVMPDLAALSPLQPRPLSGPVSSLSAPARSESGTLFPHPGGPPASAEADRVFAEGLPVSAKPGRADDFRFQRP